VWKKGEVPLKNIFPLPWGRGIKGDGVNNKFYFFLNRFKTASK
jgi:hypothetical protein